MTNTTTFPQEQEQNITLQNYRTLTRCLKNVNMFSMLLEEHIPAASKLHKYWKLLFTVKEKKRRLHSSVWGLC